MVTPAPADATREGAGRDGKAYVVSLPVFEGPLDLLLHLIEREELDITAISLVQVTDQYLSYIEALKRVDASSLADFLVVAARLILIKSQALLPRPAAALQEEDEEDPGEQLARQLREYKRFKAVARGLEQRDRQGLQCFVRLAPPPKVPSRVDLDGLTLGALLTAVRQALAVSPPAPPVDHVVSPFTVTIADRTALITRLVARGERLTFRSLLEDARSRLEIIVTLLAVLELLKRHRIAVHQPEMFGEILIEGAPEATGQEQEDAEEMPEGSPGGA